MSGGRARAFSAPDILDTLGYNKALAQEISMPVPEEFLGEPISPNSGYPIDTMFIVNETYYILVDSTTLVPFISARAATLHPQAKYAIEKDTTFLEDYTISQNYRGFPSGTLVSSGISAFVTSHDTIYPINNTVTFASLGYQWDDIVEATGEEIGIYQKQPLMQLSTPHPDGTIFFMEDTGEYFIIDGKTLRPFVSPAAAQSFLGPEPIKANSRALAQTHERSCALNPSPYPFDSAHRCTIDVSEIDSITGNAYVYTLTTSEPIHIQTLRTRLAQETSLQTLRTTLADIKYRILLRYGGEEAVTQ
jgi:hypothetical protein